MKEGNTQTKPTLRFTMEGWNRDHQWHTVQVEAKNETKAKIQARALGMNVKKITSVVEV